MNGLHSTGSAARAALPLRESARRMGAYCWLECRLFETVGAWVALVPEMQAKAVLAAHARRHAWHAELWRDQLPTAGDMTPDSLTSPADDGIAGLMTALDEAPEEPGHTIDRLVGSYRALLPRMITTYSAHLAVTSAVADEPTIRALRLVLEDELESWAEGEALLQSLLTTEEQISRAARHQGRLEGIIVGGREKETTPGGGFAGVGNGQP